MKYCSQIEHTITFHQRYIGVCNVNGYDAAPVYYELYKTRIEDMNFGKKRLSFQEMINTEKIKKFKCSHCCYIEEKDDDEKIINKYNLIILKHWTACNCNCIYCYQRKDIENGKPIYNPAPIIEDLYKQDLIDKENLVVNFHGGDIGVLENFDELVNLFKKNGYQRIDFATNNIIYQPTIEEIIREQKCTLCLSLDCGSRKTYKKIKGVDKFDTYIKNLSKYVQATENKRSINVHYILVKGINDNKREIKKFLKLMHKIGVGQVGLRLDHRYLNIWVKSPVPLKYCPDNLAEIILYFFKKAKKYNLYLEMEHKEQSNTLLKIFRTCKILKKKNPLSFKIRKFFKINK